MSTMTNIKTLWIFPLVTQIIISLFLPLFDAFNLEGLFNVFIIAAIPAFLFALICVHYQFHQRNLIQILCWSGIISFIYSLIALLIMMSMEPIDESIPMWEQSIAIIFYALMFALPSMLYAMGILRLFLRKM